MGRKKASSDTRDNVVSVRLDETSIQAIDLLVQSGLAQSRSEGAAQLIVMGIKSADDLLKQAQKLAENVQRIKNEMIDAVKKRNADVVRDLLSKNESLVNAKNEQGESAVLMSAYYHVNEIRDLLLAKGPDLDFFEACSVGDKARVQMIINLQPELINSHNRDGYTPLGLASFFGHLETVKFLLLKGANVNELSKDNQFKNTALHAAIAGSHKEIVQLLLEHKADVNIRSRGAIRAGYTALHIAAGKGEKDIALMLLDYGADLSARNDNGFTPIEYAKQKGFTELAEWLSNHPKENSF
jgi:ankyrin repeat protein